MKNWSFDWLSTFNIFIFALIRNQVFEDFAFPHLDHEIIQSDLMTIPTIVNLLEYLETHHYNDIQSSLSSSKYNNHTKCPTWILSVALDRKIRPQSELARLARTSNNRVTRSDMSDHRLVILLDYNSFTLYQARTFIKMLSRIEVDTDVASTAAAQLKWVKILVDNKNNIYIWPHGYHLDELSRFMKGEILYMRLYMLLKMYIIF